LKKQFSGSGNPATNKNMDKKCCVGDAKNSKYDATACPKTVEEMEAAILKQVRLSFTKVK